MPVHAVEILKYISPVLLRKVAGSISDGVIRIFHLLKLWPWGRLSLQQKWLSGVSSRGGGGLRRPVGRADNLATLMCRLSTNCGSFSKYLGATSTFLAPKGWHESRSTLRTYKYLVPPCKMQSPGQLRARDLCKRKLLGSTRTWRYWH